MKFFMTENAEVSQNSKGYVRMTSGILLDIPASGLAHSDYH